VLGSASGASRTIRAAELLEHGFQTAAWRDALQQPHTIKTLPVPTDAKSTATVVRNELLNRSCNGGRRVKPANAVAKVKQQRQDLAKKAAVGASPAKAGQTVAAPTPAPATKTAAPAGPVPAAKAAN
jgi:D-alanyl-D-alanine carboxypeptidase